MNQSLHRFVAHVDDFIVCICDLLIELNEIEGLTLYTVLFAEDVDEDVWQGFYCCSRETNVVLASSVELQVEGYTVCFYYYQLRAVSMLQCTDLLALLQDPRHLY